VNLRKKKTQEIVKAKRRKIIDALSKGKAQTLGADGSAAVELRDDQDLTIEEMES